MIFERVPSVLYSHLCTIISEDGNRVTSVFVALSELDD